MAVLCEAISVIVRRDSIDRYYEGGWLAFVHDLPHQKMCTDEELVSVGFWDPASVETYIRRLESKGLQFESEKHWFGVFDQSRAINDIAVIDQRDGLTRPCEWIEQMRSEVGDTGIKVLMCWLFDGERVAHGINIKGSQIKGNSIDLHTPPGWTPEKSVGLTRLDTDQLENDIQFVETRDGVDVFMNKITGKLLYKPSENDPPTRH